jgi:hypothetical protein
MKKQDNNASFEGISEAEYNKRHMKALKDAEPSGRKKIMKNKRNKLERKLDEYNHTMELIRTIVPVVILCLQVIILVKLI